MRGGAGRAASSTLGTGDSDLDGAIAKQFPEDNAAFLQHQIQEEKLDGADPAFLFAIGAVAKRNILDPEDTNYAIGIDFFDLMQQIKGEGEAAALAAASGSDILGIALRKLIVDVQLKVRCWS